MKAPACWRADGSAIWRAANRPILMIGRRVKLGALKRFRSIVGPNETGSRFEAQSISNRSGECAPRPFKPVVAGRNARADHQADHQATEVTMGYFDRARERPWDGPFQRPAGLFVGYARDSASRSDETPMLMGGSVDPKDRTMAGRPAGSKRGGHYLDLNGSSERRWVGLGGSAGIDGA